MDWVKFVEGWCVLWAELSVEEEDSEGRNICKSGAGRQGYHNLRLFVAWGSRLKSSISNIRLRHLFDLIKSEMDGFNYQPCSLVVDTISLWTEWSIPPKCTNPLFLSSYPKFHHLLLSYHSAHQDLHGDLVGSEAFELVHMICEVLTGLENKGLEVFVKIVKDVNVWRWCHGGEAAGGGGERKWRVGESDLVGWIDRAMRINFGFGRKNPPENFSGGGGVAAMVAGGGAVVAGGGLPEMGGDRGISGHLSDCIRGLGQKLKSCQEMSFNTSNCF
ncbi:hypothetical protein Tco_0073948 [Tanacetum coccineum]